MPKRAPRRCTTPGCPITPRDGHSRCPRHVQARPRTTPVEYDAEWERISAQVRREYPTCQRCRRRTSKHTDHIDGDRTNRARWNLIALCIPCHSRKTVEHDGGFGRPRSSPTDSARRPGK